MTKFANFAHNSISRAAWAVSHASGADDSAKHHAIQHVKGSAPTRLCKVYEHSKCSGFHASKHGMKPHCTCSCHQKAVSND